MPKDTVTARRKRKQRIARKKWQDRAEVVMRTPESFRKGKPGNVPGDYDYD